MSIKSNTNLYTIFASKDNKGHVLTYVVYSHIQNHDGIVAEFNTLREARDYVRKKVGMR